MNDDRVGNDRPGPFGRSAADDALAADLNALRAASARDLPTLDDTARAIARGRPRSTDGGSLMARIQNLKSRPFTLALVCGAVVALALVFVPISYQRTVGHDVTLTVSASGLDEGLIRKIAKEYRTALGAEGLRVEMGDAGCELTASVSNRSRRAVESVASAFASTLASRGIAATARVTPRVERTSGNVYAAAASRVIELDIDGRGKSAAEMEASLRSQLETAGIANSTVSVSKDGDQTRVEIHADESEGTDEHRELQLNLHAQGEGSDQSQALIIRPSENATPDEIKAQIEGELRARGVEGNVSVTSDSTDGKRRVEVRVEHHK